MAALSGGTDSSGDSCRYRQSPPPLNLNHQQQHHQHLLLDQGTSAYMDSRMDVDDDDDSSSLVGQHHLLRRTSGHELLNGTHSDMTAGHHSDGRSLALDADPLWYVEQVQCLRRREVSPSNTTQNSAVMKVHVTLLPVRRHSIVQRNETQQTTQLA